MIVRIPTRGLSAILRGALWLAGILFLFAFTAIAVWLMPASVLTPDMLPALTAGIFIIGAVVAASGREGDPDETHRRLIFLLWWLLLTSEEFFVRLNATDETVRGNFALEAYEEALVWFFVFFFAVVLMLRKPRFLEGMWQGPYRWVGAYAGLCVLSCAYATQKAFSMAWAFKLCVVVLLLQMCRSQIVGERQLKTFLNATVWGLAFLTIVPPVRALFMPGPMFVDGRLGNTISPPALSGIAGMLFITSLAVKPITGGRWTWFLAGSGAILMFMAGGKTSMAVGVLAAMLLFLMQKRIGAAAGVAIGVLAIGAVVVTLTPVSGYLVHYAEQGDAATLKARFELWDLAMPIIRHRPIQGYGYVSSRFILLQLGSLAWDPGQMHNGFIETLYNNGIVGLIAMLGIHACILRNLFRALRGPIVNQRLHGLAIGCVAIYVNIFLNGVLTANFGGRALGTFIVLLALLMIAERLVFFAGRAPATACVAAPQGFGMGFGGFDMQTPRTT